LSTAKETDLNVALTGKVAGVKWLEAQVQLLTMDT
jgi:hypothetical protein